MMEIFPIDSVENVIDGNSDMLKTKKYLLFQKCQWIFIYENTCLSNLASSRVHILGPFKLCDNSALLTQQDYKSLGYRKKISFGSQ